MSGFGGPVGVLIRLHSQASFRFLFTCRPSFSPPSASRATYAFPALVERLLSVTGKVFCPERNRLSDELFEALKVTRCNGGDVRMSVD